MSQRWSLIRLHVPPGTEIHPDRLEHLLTGAWGKFSRSPLSALLYGRPRLACEVRADVAGTHHYWAVPADEVAYMAALIRASLPGVSFEEVPDYIGAEPPEGKALAALSIRPTRPAAYALADFTPLFGANLVGMMEACRSQGEATVQLLMRPLSDRTWKERAREDLLRADGKSPGGAGVLDGLKLLLPGAEGGTGAPKATVSRAERLATRETPRKLLAPGFDVKIRLMAAASTPAEAWSIVRRLAGLFSSVQGANHLVPKGGALGARRRWQTWSKRSAPIGVGDLILTPAELASLIYPAPRAATSADGVRIIELREPPLADGIHLVDGQYQGKRVPVRVRPEDLDQHLGIFGETGSGKGVTLEHFVREAAKAELGGMYIDPMGNSVRKILASMPEELMDRVIYLEAGHDRYAIPLNVLWSPDGDVESAVSEALNLYVKLWEGSWGFNTQEVLTAATRAAIDMGGTLVEAERILTDPGFRAEVLSLINNPSIRQYLAQLPPKVSENLKAPLNKLREFLWRDSILVMVGQKKALDWARVIKERQIVLVNANKGSKRIGELGAALVSTVLWSQATQAAMAASEADRTRFFLIADELRDVAKRAGADFETGLIQLRQFQKPILGAGQYPGQLPDDVYSAMMGTGGKLVLRQEAAHARASLEYLTAERVLRLEDLSGLPNLTGFANLLAGGRKTGLFTAWAPPFSKPIRDPYEAAERCLARWATPRDEVLREINERIRAESGGSGPSLLE